MQRIKTVYVMVAIINLCAVTATFASEFYGEDDDGVSVEQALVCLKKERAYEVAITDEYIDLLNRHINSLNNIEQLLDLSHLTVLILSSNKLTALNGLANAPCLKHLYLSDNLFTALPSALCDFPALVVVDLLDNQITSVSQDDIVLHRPMTPSTRPVALEKVRTRS